MRLTPVSTTLCLAVAGALAAAPAAAVEVPRGARAVDTSDPDRWVGTGTPRSCTSRALVRAVAKGGASGSAAGPTRYGSSSGGRPRWSTRAVASCSTAAVW